ncbi:cAMP-regulated phosphoprotein 19 [Peromyscus leucopus]|uniref:cAMP-regulated phosphoprotein 19 n=1 Tax=Peromyscus leucopus TaxID=10041 RepID=UPI00188573CE|nr:cAMP-regulated phosphoprotein 19 [Peromyscus leucopus]
MKKHRAPLDGSEVRREPPQPLREKGSAWASQGRRRGDRRSTMSAEVPEAASAEEQKEMEDKVTSPEKAEEAKLKARYPHLGQKPGGSDFLRKRLQKGQKYFDSGDYNMAKAKMKNKQLPAAAPDKTEVTGDHIPTPQDLPQRKPSLVASKLAG